MALSVEGYHKIHMLLARTTVLITDQTRVSHNMFNSPLGLSSCHGHHKDVSQPIQSTLSCCVVFMLTNYPCSDNVEHRRWGRGPLQPFRTLSVADSSITP
eukprot:3560862-Amphidinium_carterae.2